MLFVTLPTNDDYTTEQDDIRLSANGDKTAFERIVRHYEKYVFSAVRSVVRDYEDSFDVAQETFLKLWHHIGDYKGEGSFSGFLYRMAKNTALDHVRKMSRRQTVSLTTENDDDERIELTIPDESTSSRPEDVALKNEQSIILHEAIDTLSDEHREMIILRDINGFSYEQIAKIKHLEEGTVKSRIFRARSALRKALEQTGYFS